MIGDNFPHQVKRMNSALTTTNCKPPPLLILQKDHKKEDKDGRKPGRPVCLARNTPNEVLSDIVSELLDKVSDAAESTTECLNTEELCFKVREVNKKLKDIDEDIVLGSLDAKALYPSLRIKESMKIVTEMVEESDIDLTSTDWKSMMNYLAVKKSEEELKECDLLKYTPKRHTNLGRKPTMKYLDSDTVQPNSSPQEDMK